MSNPIVDLAELVAISHRSRCIDEDGWAYSDFHAALTPSAWDAVIAEIRELRAKAEAPVYPDTIADGQRVLQPTAEVKIVVAPSGFAERVYDGSLGEYERLVRYVLAPPESANV